MIRYFDRCYYFNVSFVVIENFYNHVTRCSCCFLNKNMYIICFRVFSIHIEDNSVLNRLHIFIFYRIKMASRSHCPANNRQHLQQPPQYPRRRQWYLQKSSTMPQPFSPLQDLLQNGCCLNHLFQYLNQSRVPSTMPLEEFLVPKTQQIQILQMINRHLTQ